MSYDQRLHPPIGVKYDYVCLGIYIHQWSCFDGMSAGAVVTLVDRSKGGQLMVSRVPGLNPGGDGIINDRIPDNIGEVEW